MHSLNNVYKNTPINKKLSYISMDHKANSRSNSAAGTQVCDEHFLHSLHHSKLSRSSILTDQCQVSAFSTNNIITSSIIA